MPIAMIAPSPLNHLPGEHVDVLKRAGFELRYPAKAAMMSEAEMLAQMVGVSACLAGSEPYNHNVFEKLPDLKVVARAGVGWDAVDTDAATEHGVVVCIAPGTNQEAVAEHTFMLILALAKTLMAQHQPIKDGKWPRQASVPLRGRTLGIIGMGRIGKTVALRGLAFGMKVIAYEPFPDKAFVAEHGVELMSLDDVMKRGDYVSLHLPAFENTRHLINKKNLALMKPTAYLINTARGAIINEADLAEVLQAKKIAGAGLDVFEEEPPPRDNPLLQLDNVVLTAHTAGVDLKSRDAMALKAAECMAKLSQGEWPADCIVNPEVKPKFKWKG